MRIATSLLVLGLMGLTACTSPQGTSPEDKRQFVREESDDILDRLYAEHPAAREHVEEAPGYATFSNAGAQILLLGTGTGYGVVVPDSGEETFMRVLTLDAGPGVGLQTYSSVFIFEDEETMRQFSDGDWVAGAETVANAAIMDEDAVAGTANLFDEGIMIFQMGKEGLVAEAELSAKSFAKFEELNR